MYKQIKLVLVSFYLILSFTGCEDRYDVDGATALQNIIDYGNGSSVTAPTIQDYLAAGISGVTATNLTHVNELLVSNGVATTKDDVQGIMETDSDGDGVSDLVETKADSDGDGLINTLDANDNNIDTDGDGIPDGADVDVDGDTINDNGIDSDGDGINDISDVDVDGDGINDNGTDSDGDGINDNTDSIDDSLDVDNDGLPDSMDPDTNSTDSDGDGILDGADVDPDNNPNTPNNGIDSDGDGINDISDADADNDGIIDANQTDTDGDGINDENDVDLEAPVITLIGSSSVTVEAGTSYTDAGASAIDNYDGNITVVTVNPVDVNVVGTYTVTYNVNDAVGNVATQVTRTVVVEDTIPPLVVSITPIDNAVSIAVDSNIVIVFDDNMTGSTINTTNITVKDSLDNIVAGNITYDDNTGIAVFNPTSNLANYEIYTITVTTGVADDAGNALASAVTSSFTVVDGPCGCPDLDACN